MSILALELGLSRRKEVTRTQDFGGLGGCGAEGSADYADVGDDAFEIWPWILAGFIWLVSFILIGELGQPYLPPGKVFGGRSGVGWGRPGSPFRWL